MRIGVLSDVHANYPALSAVVEALRREGVDRSYCLGDVVGYGGTPAQCVEIVRSFTAGTVVGNHDAAVAGRMDYSYYYEAARTALDRHRAMLGEEALEWLRGLPYRIVLEEAGLQLCHGSPIRLEEFEYVFAPEQARECLPIWDELLPLTLVGHSHLCKVFALTKDDVTELPSETFVVEPGLKYIASVGSVGQPRDCDNRASFGIYHTERREFQYRRVEYDVEASANKVNEVRLERNFANRLFLGV
jgi:diadenosine tetraphosphatase ApaH/serine/threonine PP2A family protein phosphatase